MPFQSIHTWFHEGSLVSHVVVVGGADEAVVDGEVGSCGRQVGARVRKRLERIGTPETNGIHSSSFSQIICAGLLSKAQVIAVCQTTGAETLPTESPMFGIGAFLLLFIVLPIERSLKEEKMQ